MRSRITSMCPFMRQTRNLSPEDTIRYNRSFKLKKRIKAYEAIDESFMPTSVSLNDRPIFKF